MTSAERIEALYDSLEYLRKNNIEGDCVETGVWRGGNILGMCSYLNFYRINKKVFAYDTFKGMTPPQNIDVDFQGNKASDILQNVLCDSSLEDVKKNVSLSHFPDSNIRYVVGDICSTLFDEKNLPKKISLLRLDTDWYQSTKTGIEILYPRLSKGGVLIVDDYGHWGGCKQAIDEYFNGRKIKFEKIDYTGIKILKT